MRLRLKQKRSNRQDRGSAHQRKSRETARLPEPGLLGVLPQEFRRLQRFEMVVEQELWGISHWPGYLTVSLRIRPLVRILANHWESPKYNKISVFQGGLSMFAIF